MGDVLVFVAGTATGVGKTFVTAGLARRLAAEGLPVAARKPVQSFDPAEGPTDAELLARATGEDPGIVCPPGHSFGLPLAPPMAADALGGRRLALDALVAAVDRPENGIVLVEGVGGPRSPVAHDGDNVDLARELRPDLVLLVAEAGLGTINSVALSAHAFSPLKLLVLLNRFDPDADLHSRNRAWLTDVTGVQVAVDLPSVASRIRELLHARTSRPTSVEVR